MKYATPIKNAILASVCLVACLPGMGCRQAAEPTGQAAETEKKPHVVFVIGDEEYRSEESMPMLAGILKRELDAEVTLCFSVDSSGVIDPNRLDHIQGLAALDSADLMVLFTRFRALPEAELAHITRFAESGKPMVGFRTATHAFLYPDSTENARMNNAWPARVFGQQWITHHGHFEDGNDPLTAVTLAEGVEHPILTDVNAFQAYSWLYHVDGGDWELQGDAAPLLIGRSLRSKHEMDGRLDEFPLVNPVAWTKSYTGESGKTSRVFFTTLGHPYDFRNPNMRRLALNGIYWALGLEVPEDMDVSYTQPYQPNNSGFGEVYKKGLLPEGQLP
ncbi:MULTISPECIES: ThuA domain-containing protein [unclassified Robiginitalea]|uniref:ThuA domain-containing protein n=1 Tax=Robiginitalea TaxID=252306 RepID=UPI00234BF3D2|nr:MULTISPECIES: ThuA domain-containing protein [unclassified Robiginitalea]MDC6354602.1 ThuA domain-containing protein [Robiginitalea sp. PM2]MDC6374716.1 ThuA domain-containing protein [Robiginitalea sp. SP8]